MSISKKDLISFLSFVQNRIQSDKYSVLNIAKYLGDIIFEDKIQDVIKKIELVPSETISVDKAYELRKIKRHWVIFDKNFDGNINDGYKFSYGILIDEFRSFLEHINDICTSQFKQWCSSSKILDAKGLDEKLSRLSRAREKLKKELELQNLSPQKDAEIIKTLRIQLEKMDAEYLAALEAKKKCHLIMLQSKISQTRCLRLLILSKIIRM